MKKVTTLLSTLALATTLAAQNPSSDGTAIPFRPRMR